MPRALISVSDKRGVVEFARGLVELGWEIVSTGGTAATLRDGAVPVIEVERLTGFPELLDGRVKTLHPMVHAALLARRDLATHRSALEKHGITPIDLVAVNLYPFRLTISRHDASLEDAIENIDVGGPSMLRSASKNYESVLPVVDPTDYPEVLAMLRAGPIDPEVRREFSAKVFAHTADYDAAIAAYLTPKAGGLPSRIGITMDEADVELLRALIHSHEEKTVSARARTILTRWDEYLPLFRKVVAKAGQRGAGEAGRRGGGEAGRQK